MSAEEKRCLKQRKGGIGIERDPVNQPPATRHHRHQPEAGQTGAKTSTGAEHAERGAAGGYPGGAYHDSSIDSIRRWKGWRH